MGIKDKMRSHFAGLREWHSLEVPEWEETIYFRRPSLEQEASFSAQAQNNDPRWIAKLIIAMAHTSMHVPLFTEDDLDLLTKHSDPAVVVRVGLEIHNRTTMDKHEAKKPLETTDSSAPPSTSPSAATTS